MDYMIERLKAMKRRLSDIDKILMDGQADNNTMTALSKERASLDEPVSMFNELTQMESDRNDAESMMKDPDPDMKAFGKETFDNLGTEIEKKRAEIQVALLPKDINDDKNIIMEIRGAAGGDEANIFAGDLYRMYSHYAEKKNWKISVMDSQPTPLGGFSLISFKIVGKGVYSRLKFESGAHRVQRVPVTEANGRIQTSTATVLVMPEVEHVNITINPADLQIDTFHSSGAGGQNVNKTESAVRITHKPSGIVVSCQIERDQLANKETCMEMLKAKLQAKQDSEMEEKIGGERRLKLGTGERNERIRTYNYPQNRVTDHRIGFTSLNLPRIMDGDIDEMITALNEANQKDMLLEETKKLEEMAKNGQNA
ncbi:MAG: peptide chain release factor 1 [Bacilli bacterium]